MEEKPSRRCADHEAHRAVLRDVPLFAELPENELGTVLERCRVVTVEAGDWLLRAGDPADSLFVVIHGRLQFDYGGGKRRQVTRGEVFGEVGILTGQPRAVGVQAVRESELLSLPAAEFDRLVDTHPGWLRQVTHIVVNRLLTADGLPDREQVLTIAVVSNEGDEDGDGDLRAAERWRAGRAVALGLTGALAAAARTTLAAFDDAPAPDGRARWAHALEDEHRYLVFDASTGPAEWRAWCIKQSDRVALVVETAEQPRRRARKGGPLDQAINRRAAVGDLSLLLVHPPDVDRPVAVASTLASTVLAPHLNMRRTVEPGRTADGSAGGLLRADVARAARLLTGRGQGVVLGGGGPRGFAHLGVLKALDEAGVPVDMVGGTSIGAVMGALRAMDLDPDERIRRAMVAFVESGSLLPPTLPVLSFSSASKIRRLLEAPQNLGNLAIEECWLPYFCVSANLTRAETVVHESGSLATAVRASMSLPGILPPVRWGSDFLVDGGVLNNLPVDVMRGRLGRGSILAVDLIMPVEVPAPAGYIETPSGWRLLAERLLHRGKAPGLPLSFGILMRAKDLAGIAAQREMLATHPPDVLIRPDVADCAMFDFKAAKNLIDIGYREALARLEDGTVPLHAG